MKVIPTHNDGEDEFKEMVEWILENCDDNIPLHFTAFHPTFKMKHYQVKKLKAVVILLESLI